MRALWFLLVVFVQSQVVFAGQVQGTINSLYVRESDGLVLVEMSGTPSGKPACAINPYWLIKTENSEAGKKQYAMLLAAKLSGATVLIYGANTCARWFDGEDIAIVQVL